MSKAIACLQGQIGVNDDGVFGKDTLKAARDHWKMTDAEAVHFFAQCCHETGNFITFTENLNYSADGLMTVFKKYFPDKLIALAYQRQPERIANRVYANRMGNGDELSGDGWRYRGRGALQLTGRNNYQEFFDRISRPDLIDTPDVVADEYAFQSARHFFKMNGLWSICNRGIDQNTVTELTKRINGGTNGLQHRIELTERFKTLIRS
jgi:putative chitinase